MKTSIIYSSLFLILLIFPTSCSDFLSDVQPSDQLPIETAFSSAADLEAAMIGAYDAIQHGHSMGRIIPSMADLFAHNGSSNYGFYLEVSTLQMEADHSLPLDLWKQCYKAINQVNAILKVLPEIIIKDAIMSEEQANRLEGEALFIRGVLYFELVRLFALPFPDFADSPGVPIMLEPVLKKVDIQFPARASVKEVYAQVNSDIEKAVALLPEPSAPWKVNRFTAIAYLARIAFQQGDYISAASLSDTIINAGFYSLSNTPEEVFFTESSTEEVWVVPSSADDPIEDFGLASVYNDAPSTAAITDNLREKGYAAIMPDFQLAEIKMIDTSWIVVDLRCDPGAILSSNLIVSNDEAGDTTRCNKYENSWLQEIDDTPNARLAEFILMRAEALVFIQGINEESIDLLNQIRRRSLRVLDQNGDVVAESKDFVEFKINNFQHVAELLATIQLERRVELAFEGNYFHDLMRLKKDVQHKHRTYPYNANELRLPIPQREIDANLNLKQNPGY